jgi:hypothetical protein
MKRKVSRRKAQNWAVETQGKDLQDYCGFLLYP